MSKKQSDAVETSSQAKSASAASGKAAQNAGERRGLAARFVAVMAILLGVVDLILSSVVRLILS